MESRDIREAILPANDEELGNAYNNLGNVESGEGRQDMALQYFERANETRKNVPAAETSIGTSCINMARAYLQKGDLKSSAENYEKARSLYERNFGAEGYPMQGCVISMRNGIVESLPYQYILPTRQPLHGNWGFAKEPGLVPSGP
jgi:tetratricopeptide (TPR) repeat protein